MTDSIYRGDDTDSFGQTYMIINKTNEEDYFVISKIVLQCGPVQKTFENPEFPIYVNFTSDETKKLYRTNQCYLKVYDENGLGHTCEGTCEIITTPQLVGERQGGKRYLQY